MAHAIAEPLTLAPVPTEIEEIGSAFSAATAAAAAPTSGLAAAAAEVSAAIADVLGAVGYLIAADVGLATVAGGVEFRTLVSALSSNVKDIQSLIP